MRRLAILLCLTGCTPAASPPGEGRATRIVSLDYCADQYVLKLARRRHILALSPDATSEFSYLHDRAKRIRQVRPSAEDVLLLKPDLIVRSYGGGPNLAPLMERAGVPVLQLGYADDLPGVRRVLIDAAAGLGEVQRGAAVAQAMDRRVAALRGAAVRRTALYVTPGGITSGRGTLVDAMLSAGGLRNFQTSEGWGPLPLERLAYERPDVIAAAFFDTRWNRPDPWSASAHPVAARAMKGRPTVALPGAWTACGGWFLLDAVERLAGVAL